MRAKRCIVSFANNRGNYIRALNRLRRSLKGRFDGDFLGYVGEASIGSPLHEDHPYAFKIYAIKKAIEAGYEQILWLDSSCFAIASVQPIFDSITNDGFIFQDSGHHLGTWTNDRTLEYFNLKRDEAMIIPMIGNAGFLGIDLMAEKGREFFEEWQSSLEYFKGAWNNNNKTESQDERCKGHRHDMSCSSAIVHRLGLTGIMKRGDEWLQYAGVRDVTLNETIIIKAQGI